MIEKRIKISPVAKPRMTRADNWNKRPIVLKYWEYKDKLRFLMTQQNISIKDNICIEFYVAMPESWSKSRKAQMDGTYHQSRPDIDNLLKGFMDALFEEDCHIHSVNAKKIWALEPSILILDC
jgi:Holliday junction resolvase RusA-like endonuclease